MVESMHADVGFRALVISEKLSSDVESVLFWRRRLPLRRRPRSSLPRPLQLRLLSYPDLRRSVGDGTNTLGRCQYQQDRLRAERLNRREYPEHRDRWRIVDERPPVRPTLPASSRQPWPTNTIASA